MTETGNRNHRQGFSTRAIHLGYDPQTAHGALTPPIYQTSTYTFESVEQGAQLFAGERDGYIYGRTKNPTQALLEQRLADLEGGEAAVALASGMGAISATFWSLLKAGDRVIADKIVYGNSYALLTKGLTKFGIRTDLIDMTDLEAVRKAAREPFAAVFFETPANPNLRLIDIAAVSAIARARNALTIVDNTFATPVLQRPIEHGADLVVHSATKYLGGHGDLLAGLVVGKAELTKEIRMHGLRYMTGATLSPLVAFLILRGLKTLELRIRQHTASATEIARFLLGQPHIADVHYPALAKGEAKSVYTRQMSGGGGLVSFEYGGGLEKARRFMNSLRLVHRAVSLGDAETLIQHPATMTHAAYGAEERARHGITDGLIRFSVGLENTEDILDDLRQALDAAARDAP
ncbi:MAG: aminotransferase class I/II-fold pyridoxal phosphate-dependent enzyme [Proteobacteria bacterium]|nr:aminotransferase class I/II-fold pyridoxal phosphate-dependent enzyme [Pseudomonadota bacterium]